MSRQELEQQLLRSLDGMLDELHEEAREGSPLLEIEVPAFSEDGEELLRFEAFLSMQEPSSATDHLILQAARNALQRTSPQPEEPVLSWWQRLLAMPSFRPALGFAMVFLIVGGAFWLQQGTVLRKDSPVFSADQNPALTARKSRKKRLRSGSPGRKTDASKSRKSLQETQHQGSSPANDIPNPSKNLPGPAQAPVDAAKQRAEAGLKRTVTARRYKPTPTPRRPEPRRRVKRRARQKAVAFAPRKTQSSKSRTAPKKPRVKNSAQNYRGSRMSEQERLKKEEKARRKRSKRIRSNAVMGGFAKEKPGKGGLMKAKPTSPKTRTIQKKDTTPHNAKRSLSPKPLARHTYAPPPPPSRRVERQADPPPIVPAPAPRTAQLPSAPKRRPSREPRRQAQRVPDSSPAFRYQQRAGRAIQQATGAGGSRGGNASSFYKQGQQYERKRRYSSAERAYRKALGLRPSALMTSDLHFRLGRLALRRRSVTRARSHFDEYIRRASQANRKTAIESIARLYRRAGYLREAKRILSRLKSSNKK